MTKIQIFALLLTWYLTGVSSFVYWWTDDYDLTSREIPTAAVAGLLGVFSFPLGYIIHGDRDSKVIMQKRGE